MKWPHICSNVELPVKLSSGDYRIYTEVTICEMIKIGMNAPNANYTLCATEPVIGAENQCILSETWLSL